MGREAGPPLFASLTDPSKKAGVGGLGREREDLFGAAAAVVAAAARDVRGPASPAPPTLCSLPGAPGRTDCLPSLCHLVQSL